MVVNNLLMRLKTRSSEEIGRIEGLLLGLDGQVPSLSALEVRRDLRGPEKAEYDLMLTTRFESLDGFEAYLSHPAHVEVSDLIKEAIAAGASFRYEA